jgi:hypothetical protein
VMEAVHDEFAGVIESNGLSATHALLLNLLSENSLKFSYCIQKQLLK